MSRFSQLSLVKRTDERLRPSEKELHERFFQKDNIKFIYLSITSNIHRSISYNSVLEIMNKVFRASIINDNHPSIDDMNLVCFSRARKEYESKLERQTIQKERTFNNSNIPTRILPRPSMALEKSEDDESRGKHIIEMLR